MPPQQPRQQRGSKVQCKMCKKEVYVYPCLREVRKYCSRKCLNLSKTEILGEKHHMWKGDGAGYHALHKWIARRLGKPRCCQHCGTTVAKRFEWANKSRKYRRQLEDWLRLCNSCHQRYDAGHRQTIFALS